MNYQCFFRIDGFIQEETWLVTECGEKREPTRLKGADPLLLG